MAKGKNPGSDRFKTVIEPDTRLLALDGEINRLVLQIELLEARRRRAGATGASTSGQSVAGAIEGWCRE